VGVCFVGVGVVCVCLGGDESFCMCAWGVVCVCLGVHEIF
jgi:hypothetical protein